MHWNDADFRSQSYEQEEAHQKNRVARCGSEASYVERSVVEEHQNERDQRERASDTV